MFSKPIFPLLNPVGIANSHYQYNIEGGYVPRLPWGFSPEKRCKKPDQHLHNKDQGGITCGAINEPRKSSKAINKRVIIDFRDKNAVIAPFPDINEVFI